MKIRNLVIGFAFNSNYDLVIMIRKNRPQWQKGYLNGIGGKVEPEDYEEAISFPLITPFEVAMQREFKEEAGVDTEGWEMFCKQIGSGYILRCYQIVLSDDDFDKCKSMTDELVVKICVNDILMDTEEFIHDVMWLIPLALGEGKHR